MSPPAPTGTTVAGVEARAYTFPTDAPEADGTFAWDSTTMVLVQVRTADDTAPTGTGWTYAPAAASGVVDELLAPVVLGRDAADPVGAWTAMVAAVRNAGRVGLVGMAISAVDTALWDLRARLLGVPLHRLWGAATETVQLYGSGGFTTYSDDRMREQLQGWCSQGFDAVKIKIGESRGKNEERDLHRVAEARRAVGDQVALFVDANGGYGVGQAVRVGHRLDEMAVRWFEEPVTSDDLAGLRQVRERVEADVAAGEYGFDLASFEQLTAARSVDCVQVDVTRCGGYTEWLRICALAAARQLEVSGHCAPYLHAPVAAATPNLRHLEWFHDHVRIEQRLLRPDTDGTGGVLRLGDRPGHGWTPHLADVEEHRVR